MRRFFTSAQLPKYHDSLLIMRMREGPLPSASAFAGTSLDGPSLPAAAGQPPLDPPDAPGFNPGLPPTPGLSVLAMLERGGLVKRVIPLERPSPGVPPPALIPRRAMCTLAAAATSGAGQRRGSGRPGQRGAAGVCLLELEREHDVSELQDALARDPHIEFVSRVPVRYLMAKGAPVDRAQKPPARTNARRKNGPPAEASLWNLRKIRWSQARALPGFKDANRVRVAVLDSGIDKQHPDLKRRVASYVYAHPDTPSLSAAKDIVGHGTHVAGTIGAIVNNDIGINGVCQCRLHAWKIFNDTPELLSLDHGFAYLVDPVMYLRALADCLDDEIDVVNLSIGGVGEPDAQEQQLFDALLARGTTVVAAMGNERDEGSPISYPAAIPGVIAVGATTVNDTVTTFSNRGDHIALCAPGKAIWSTLPTYTGQFGFEAVRGAGGRAVEGKAYRREVGYDAWDGTSMAAPHVAAAAALAIARHGRLDGEDVRTRLTRSADRTPGMKRKAFHPDYGSGRLNLLRLLG